MFHYLFIRRIHDATWTIEVTPTRITMWRGPTVSWTANLSRQEFGSHPNHFMLLDEGYSAAYDPSRMTRVGALRLAVLMVLGTKMTTGPMSLTYGGRGYKARWKNTAWPTRRAA
jgi:hypothetical protein